MQKKMLKMIFSSLFLISLFSDTIFASEEKQYCPNSYLSAVCESDLFNDTLFWESMEEGESKFYLIYDLMFAQNQSNQIFAEYENKGGPLDAMWRSKNKNIVTSTSKALSEQRGDGLLEDVNADIMNDDTLIYGYFMRIKNEQNDPTGSLCRIFGKHYDNIWQSIKPSLQKDFATISVMLTGGLGTTGSVGTNALISWARRRGVSNVPSTSLPKLVKPPPSKPLPQTPKPLPQTPNLLQHTFPLGGKSYPVGTLVQYKSPSGGIIVGEVLRFVNGKIHIRMDPLTKFFGNKVERINPDDLVGINPIQRTR